MFNVSSISPSKKDSDDGFTEKDVQSMCKFKYTLEVQKRQFQRPKWWMETRLLSEQCSLCNVNQLNVIVISHEILWNRFQSSQIFCDEFRFGFFVFVHAGGVVADRCLPNSVCCRIQKTLFILQKNFFSNFLFPRFFSDSLLVSRNTYFSSVFFQVQSLALHFFNVLCDAF